MKRFNVIVLIALVFSFLSIGNVVVAGGSAITKYKRSCNPDYRYKARARAGCLLIFTNVQSQWGCGQTVTATAQKFWNGNLAATQTVTNGPGGITMSGAVYRNFCSRGEPIAEALADYYSNETNEGEGLEEYTISVGSTQADYEGEMISINDVSGDLAVDHSNFLSTLRLVIWTPVSDDDEDVTADKTIWEAYIRVSDGQLETQNIDASMINYNLDEGIAYYSFQGLNFEVNLPGYDLENLALSVITDGEPLADKGMKAAAEESTELLAARAMQISLSPNPATDLLKVGLGSETAQQGSYDVKIYDITGKTLVSQSDAIQMMGKKREEVEINVAGLAPGIYFVGISNGESSYLQKFVKQ